jgi:DNA-directed RNA polymerase specialized sigma24 family protein
MGPASSDAGCPVSNVDSDCLLDLIAAVSQQKRARSLEELARLFEEHKPRLLRMVRARLSPQLRARDGEEGVLHNVYVRAQRAWLKQRPDPSCVFVWLYGKTWSEVIDQIRHGRAGKCDAERESPWPDESVAEVGQRLGLSTHLDLKDAVEVIRQVLKPIEFEIVWMHSVDDLTFPDIASVLTAREGKPVTDEAVRKRYLRAVEKAQAKTDDPFVFSSGRQARRPGDDR